MDKSFKGRLLRYNGVLQLVAIDEITIPQGTRLTVQDMGDCVVVIAPDEYKGLMFTECYDMEDDEDPDDDNSE